MAIADSLSLELGRPADDAARVANRRVAAVLREHQGALRGLAMRLAGNAADAEDLVQDALERGLRRAHELPADANVRAWLVTILHNLFIDQCRRRRRRPRATPAEIVEAVPAPEPTPEPSWASLSGADLRAAVARLEPEFRAVYELHALRRRSYDEIAAELGIAKATVGTRLYRARHKLRALLAEEMR